MTGGQLSGADATRHVGARLAAARTARGMSLADVDRLSGGSWTAARVGSYERANRAGSLTRLWDLACWYEVPFVSLLPADGAAAREADVLRGVVADAAAILAGEVAARLKWPDPPTDPAPPVDVHAAELEQQVVELAAAITAIARLVDADPTDPAAVAAAVEHALEGDPT